MIFLIPRDLDHSQPVRGPRSPDEASHKGMRNADRDTAVRTGRAPHARRHQRGDDHYLVRGGRVDHTLAHSLCHSGGDKGTEHVHAPGQKDRLRGG